MLVNILKEPKNAILKQYQKLLELDEVKLEFTDDALRSIARKAMEKIQVQEHSVLLLRILCLI